MKTMTLSKRKKHPDLPPYFIIHLQLAIVEPPFYSSLSNRQPAAMHFYQSFSILSFAAAVIASPVPAPGTPPARECKAVQGIVDVLQLAKATPFCSSFLKIPVSTSVSTATVYSTLIQTTDVPVATNAVVTATMYAA
jgi:hypothetical protein